MLRYSREEVGEAGVLNEIKKKVLDEPHSNMGAITEHLGHASPSLNQLVWFSASVGCYLQLKTVSKTPFYPGRVVRNEISCDNKKLLAVFHIMK